MKRLLSLLLALAFLVTFAVGASTGCNNHSGVPEPAATQKGKPDIKVWVSTKSGVYHCPGTKWYGATKEGEYMTEKEAQGKGYRPAYGNACE
jgi:hypothetical protein